MGVHETAISILAGGLSVTALWVAVRLIGRRRKETRQRIRELHRLWDLSEPQRRVEALDQRLGWHDESPAADRPGSEAARAENAFYLGCAYLAERRPARAARMFQVAYHADRSLPAALVLAFACLKVGAGRWEDLPDKCAETWRELGSPNLGQSHREKLLLRKGGGAYEVLAPLVGLPRGKAASRAWSRSTGCVIEQ